MAEEVLVLAIDKNLERRKIIRSCFLYNFGIFLYWSAYNAMFSLQSSINVEEGLGTTTLGVSFTVSVVFALFFVPVLVRKFGVKFWLLMGDAGLFPFILANLYPRYYTLLPSAILMGVLESLMWPCMSMLNVLFASLYACIGNQSKHHYTLYFAGHFYLAYQGSQVSGNLLSYVILYAFDQTQILNASTTQGYAGTLNATLSAKANSTYKSPDSQYVFCGANDCQDPSVIGESLDQYKPVNPVSLYVLVGAILFLETMAFLIHLTFVPDMKTFAKEMERHDEAVPLTGCDKSKVIAEVNVDDSRLREDVAANTDVEDGKESRGNEKIGFIDISKAALKHCMEPKLLLLVPLTVYNGLAMSFVVTELTRAFTSCATGVQWVGISMAVYGLSNCTLSWFAGKFGRKIGAVVTIFIALVLQCGNFIYALHWSPGPNVLPSIVAMFFMYGLTDGIFQTIVNVIHIDFFDKDQDVAINIWNVLVVSGFALGFGLSTVLCVDQRIYFNMSCLVVGFLGLIVASILHKKELAQELEKKGISHDSALEK